MRKTFAEYAADRARRATPEEATAVRVFDAAYAKLAVGSALASARKARQLNQAALAELTGMSQGDISKIERGVVAPTTLTLLKLVHALGAELTLSLPGVSGSAVAQVDESAASAEPLSMVLA